MYSINVFLTFSLSMLGMSRHWWQQRGAQPALEAATGAVRAGGADVPDDPGHHHLREVRGRRLAHAGDHGHLHRPVLPDPPRIPRASPSGLQKLDQTLGQLATPQTPPNLADPDPSSRRP